MVIYNFIKYLILYIKYAKIVRQVFEKENLLKSFSLLFNADFRIDWVGRVYTVLNPMVQQMEDPTIGSGVAIYEFTESGELSNRMWVEKWVMDHLMAAQRFIQANNLFDLLTYDITRLDDNENYLFVLQPLYFKEAKKWTKRMVWLISFILIIGITLLCVL